MHETRGSFGCGRLGFPYFICGAAVFRPRCLFVHVRTFAFRAQTFFVVSEEEIEEQLLPDYPPSFSLLQSQCLFAEPGER